MATRVSLKRFLPTLILAAFVATVVVSQVGAGGISDDPCGGDALKICPQGTVGVPYSIKLGLTPGSGCAEGDDTWHVIGGELPAGLSLALNGTISGTPTLPGESRAWIEMRLPNYPPSGDPPTGGCNGAADSSQREFSITIQPGVPKLTIGPEAAPVGTVGTSYQLPMTATVADPKTWSIATGTLPPGLTINPASGLISGMPTTQGSYPFTVSAVIDAQRSDTKALTIVVRAPLAIEASDDPLAEVGVRFQMALIPSGGSQVYTWSQTTGELPPGLTFANGAITGRPTLPGDYAFIITLSDTEARTATYAGELTVAPRLRIPNQRLKPGKVGKRFRVTLKSVGGAGEAQWRLKRGPLPKGILFDRTTGTFIGVPAKPGTWRVQVEIRDELGVKTSATVVLVVKPSLLRR